MKGTDLGDTFSVLRLLAREWPHSRTVCRVLELFYDWRFGRIIHLIGPAADDESS